MTVRELKEKLKLLPDGMEVMIPRVDGDAMYTHLQTVTVKPIRFHECEESEAECECKAVATDDCVILDEQ